MSHMKKYVYNFSSSNSEIAYSINYKLLRVAIAPIQATLQRFLIQ